MPTCSALACGCCGRDLVHSLCLPETEGFGEAGCGKSARPV